MKSDDLVPVVAVAFGAALSLSVTALAIERSVVSIEPPPEMQVGWAPLASYESLLAPVELMVGPEGAHSGWLPPPRPRAP